MGAGDQTSNTNTFARRLQQAVEAQGLPVSPTVLAREFNLRWRGMPVSVNATRKWLYGPALPTLDKLTVLAHMLNTSEDWLKWGVGPGSAVQVAQDGRGTYVLASQNHAIAQDFGLLTPTNQQLLLGLMELMLKQQQAGRGPQRL